MKEIFFVGGLPRSGSTLLMNLIAQNEDVFCTPTSGLPNLLNNIKTSWSNILEHRADKNAAADENLKRTLNTVFYNYHNTEKSFVFDKSRAWSHNIEMIEAITNKKVKIIAPVRDIKDILSSFESLYRKGSYKFEPQGPMPQCLTTEGRIQHWGSLQGEVGAAYAILKDSFLRGYSDRFLLVDYDFLTHNPKYVMDKIWEFLGIPKIEHDFNNIINKTPEDDTVYNYVNLHKIKNSIIPSKSKAIEVLGNDICKTLQGYEFWKNLAKY
jgi:sulfotransferase